MSEHHDFSVGCRVVCTDNSQWDRTVMSACPEVGKVYTVRNLAPYLGGGHTGLMFVEVRSFVTGRLLVFGSDAEWWFQSIYFKPLDERRLDVFRQILVNASIWGGAQK